MPEVDGAMSESMGRMMKNRLVNVKGSEQIDEPNNHWVNGLFSARSSLSLS